MACAGCHSPFCSVRPRIDGHTGKRKGTHHGGMASIRSQGSRYRVFVKVDGRRATKVFDTKRQALAWAQEAQFAGRALPDKTLADACKRLLGRSKRAQAWPTMGADPAAGFPNCETPAAGAHSDRLGRVARCEVAAGVGDPLQAGRSMQLREVHPPRICWLCITVSPKSPPDPRYSRLGPSPLPGSSRSRPTATLTWRRSGTRPTRTRSNRPRRCPRFGWSSWLRSTTDDILPPCTEKGRRRGGPFVSLSCTHWCADCGSVGPPRRGHVPASCTRPSWLVDRDA